MSATLKKKQLEKLHARAHTHTQRWCLFVAGKKKLEPGLKMEHGQAEDQD